MPTTRNYQRERSVQEVRTVLTPTEVLAEARSFFERRNGVYSAFLEMEGPSWLTFRGQGGEEIVLAASQTPEGTLVTGSTYLFDQQVARFLASLPPVDAATPNPVEHVARTRGAA